MKKVNRNNLYNYNQDDEDYNDISKLAEKEETLIEEDSNDTNENVDTVSGVADTSNVEVQHKNLKYVDKNKKIKMLIAIVVAIVVLVIIIVANSANTKTQKGTTISSDEENNVTYVQPTVDNETTSYIYENNDTSIPPDLSVYGTWDASGDGSELLVLNSDYSFNYIIKDDNGSTTTYAGNAVVGCGEKGLSLAGKTSSDVVNTFGIAPEDYNPDNFYVVRCKANKVKEGNEKYQDIVTKPNEEQIYDADGASDYIFEKELYLYDDDKDNLVAEYYDEDGLSKINVIRCIRGEE